MKYDFFIAGKWRNNKEVRKVMELVRGSGYSAYCFIENLYEGEKIEFDPNNIEAVMQQLEALTMEDPLVKKIFDTDIMAEKESEMFLLVLPAGTSANIEAGAAYGMGKKCYAVGHLEKTETLYKIFDKIFPDLAALEKWLLESKSN